MERSDKSHHSNYNMADIKDTLQIIHGEGGRIQKHKQTMHAT